MSALFKPEMLKRMFKKCKLQPVAFAFVEGEEEMLLVMSDTMAGKALFEKAKKEADARKGTFGTARLNGDTLELAVDKNFSGLKAKFTGLAKEEGFKIKKCRIVDSTGAVSEDGEGADGAAPTPAPTAGPTTATPAASSSETEPLPAPAPVGESPATPPAGETTPESEGPEGEAEEGERIPFERLQRVTGKAADAWDKAWKMVGKQALDQQKAIFAEGDPANNPVVRAMAKWHKAIPDFGGAVHGLRDAAQLAQPDAWHQASAHYRTVSKAFRAHLGTEIAAAMEISPFGEVQYRPKLYPVADVLDKEVG